MRHPSRRPSPSVPWASAGAAPTRPPAAASGCGRRRRPGRVADARRRRMPGGQRRRRADHGRPGRRLRAEGARRSPRTALAGARHPARPGPEGGGALRPHPRPWRRVPDAGRPGLRRVAAVQGGRHGEPADRVLPVPDDHRVPHSHGQRRPGPGRHAPRDPSAACRNQRLGRHRLPLPRRRGRPHPRGPLLRRRRTARARRQRQAGDRLPRRRLQLRQPRHRPAGHLHRAEPAGGRPRVAEAAGEGPGSAARRRPAGPGDVHEPPGQRRPEEDRGDQRATGTGWRPSVRARSWTRSWNGSARPWPPAADRSPLTTHHSPRFPAP